MKRVVDIMGKDVVTVDEENSVAEAAMKMREKSQGCAIVLRHGSPAGIVTERDVTWQVAGKSLHPKNVKVSDIMSKSLVTIDPDADLMEAAKIMAQNEIRRLPVVRQGILYGILTAADVARNVEGYVDTEMRKILRYAFFSPIHG